MQFKSVISAISKFFKTMSVNRSDVSKDFSPFIPFYFGYILLNEKCSKVLYQLINSKDIVPKAIQKWNTELSLHLDINDSVKDFFKVCFKTTTDTSIQ